MKLSYKEQCVRIVDYRDLEDLIRETFGFDDDYSIVADMEWHNDSDYHFTIKKDPHLGEHEFHMENLLEFVKSYGSKHFFDLFEFLANQEIIEEGDYLVQVMW